MYTFESDLIKWMTLERIIQSEVSKKEKNKYHILMHIYIYIYIWNLERWYWWSCFQDGNTDVDLEDRFVATVGEGEGGQADRIALKQTHFHM